MSIRSLRQDIARIQTLISQKTAVEQA